MHCRSGFLSILYSIGSKPLQIWDKQGNWEGWFGDLPGYWVTLLIEAEAGWRVCSTGMAPSNMRALRTLRGPCWHTRSSQWAHQAHHRPRHPEQRA
jgi:hypothetical protein